MVRFIVIDLFVGCGGMFLGLEVVGFDIVVVVEFDVVYCLVYYYNFFYGVIICWDIVLVSVGEILRKLNNKGYLSDIDLIVGGFFC